MVSTDYIVNAIKGKKIVILGFGKEGISTYRFIRKYFPDMPLTVADGNPNLKTDEFQDKKLKFVKGPGYDQDLNKYDLIFKTPGISFNNVNYWIDTFSASSITSHMFFCL